MSSGNFPKDLRVLVYGEELVHLQFYGEYLQRIQYQVTTCCNEKRAMRLLCVHRNMFDIALMDVKKPDGYIFQSISKIDLPIIIISEDKSVASVTKWMTNGACDYLVKPLRPEDLELIYKNVVRGKKSVVTGEKVAGEESSSDRACASTSKKRRVVWDQYLRNKFCDAMNYLGQKAVPKSILEHMKVPHLTRDHVASHLQKHRKNENMKKTESTIPKERQEANHEEASIAIPNRNSGMANQQQRNHQTTNITRQQRSDDYIGDTFICDTNKDAEMWWFYNGGFNDSPFNTNVDRWYSMLPHNDLEFNNNSGH